MEAQELRKLLEQTDDKLSIFANVETLKKYKLNVQMLCDLIKDFLNDEEKLKLFDYSHFKQFKGIIKSKIINLVSDDDIILKMINNDEIMNGLSSYDVVDITKKMSDNAKVQLLHNQDLINKHKINSYGLQKIISSLTEEAKTEILLDTDLTKNELKLVEYEVGDLLEQLSSDTTKDKAIEIYQFGNYTKVKLINTCSNSHKLDVLLKEDFYKNNIIDILETLDTKTLSEFLAEHKEFCKEKEIHPYEIIRNLEPEQQKEFIANLDNSNLTLSEKREILATLHTDVKQSIDATNFPEEYKTALSMQTDEYGVELIFDWERNLEDYCGLDNLISINPEELTEEQKNKLLELCDICPNAKVVNGIDNDIVTFESTATEYKEAEEWITSILDSLKPEYSIAQKIAIIDNAIGQKISYSPDFGTEVFDNSDCRAIWKIISSGYGVCNGIARLEQYILKRAAIESELISSNTHTFLKINNIEIPLANGEIAKGNTILDPTWNLAAHRFGGKPNNFFISYEQARKNDIDSEGKDHYSHKNDEQLQDATLNLDEQSLRQLFASVDLADKEGPFPIKNLIDKSKQIDKFYANNPEQNINKQFSLLQQTCPEFAKCQNSSMSVLSDILLSNENMNFDKCVVNRVYDKADNQMKPVLYVYIDSNELGEKFYFADKEKGQFIELPQEEFTKQFECYEKDLEKNKRT